PGMLLIYRGTGAGTFANAATFTLANPGTYYVGADVTALAVGDVNGDGAPDIAVATATGQLCVFLNSGLGTFGPAIHSQLGVGITTLAVGDFNSDGHLDLAAVGPTKGVEVLLGNGDGTCRPPQVIAADPAPESLVVADFNRDGKLDIATADAAGYAT